MSVQSRVSYSSRSAFVFANNHHIRTLDTTFDLTGCVRTGEAVSLVHGVHSDIKIARVYGRRCCVKIPRFVGDYSHQDSLREFRQVSPPHQCAFGHIRFLIVSSSELYKKPVSGVALIIQIYFPSWDSPQSRAPHCA